VANDKESKVDILKKRIEEVKEQKDKKIKLLKNQMLRIENLERKKLKRERDHRLILLGLEIDKYFPGTSPVDVSIALAKVFTLKKASS